ncbi:MAG: exosortase/archaeosortase family protein [Pirellulales bacterium]|nr:exosortase/archaeosortase family protein [Pirellulales bacterium]
MESKSKNMLVIGSIALLVALIAVYFPVLTWLVDTWWGSPDYTYGFFVPIFAAYLLWDRRDMLKADQLKGSYLAIPIILLTIGVYMFANEHFNHVLLAWTIVPMVGGLVLLVGGWHAVQWAWPSVFFLFFMSPLPQDYAGMLGSFLQVIGANISVFILQTLGMRAIAEGTVIVLDHSQLGVEEACSGIRMLMLFFAASVGAALYLRTRPPVIRIIIAASAPPIAIIANVTRITVTAFLYENVSKELGDKIFHDLVGWWMMPMAIGLVWLEMALLDNLFVVHERETIIPLGMTAPRPKPVGETRPPLPVNLEQNQKDK